jgi:hypothetical protein
MLLSAAWLLQKFMSFGGLAAALAGVATFGWHFCRINAVAAQGDSSQIPPESWRGPGARAGMAIFAAGIALAAASMVIGASLPSRY